MTPLDIGVMKYGQLMQPLPFLVSHKIGQPFDYAFLKCIKERKVEGYQVENELPKALVGLFTLTFMRGAP